MVPPDSHGISGVPYYLGLHKRVQHLRLQEYYLLCCAFPSASTSINWIFDSSTGQQPDQCGPTTPHMQHLSVITHIRFGLFRFRSPLLTESLLFSFPMGTEMFHFPTFPPTTLYIQVEVAGHDSGFFRGFPIRKSQDLSLFTSSPGLIAGYNVLHRLLVPRHPPIALSSLSLIYKDARVHCTVLKTRAENKQNQPHKVINLISPARRNRKRPFRTQQCAHSPYPDQKLSTHHPKGISCTNKQTKTRT